MRPHDYLVREMGKTALPEDSQHRRSLEGCYKPWESSAGNLLVEVMDFHYLPDMAMVLEAEAKLTAQNQITIPAAVRKALKLQGGQSRVKFQILPEDGRVVVLRAEPASEEHEDPALEPFLAWLQKDMMQHPQQIAPFPAPLLERARSLVESVDVDFDGTLTGED